MVANLTFITKLAFSEFVPLPTLIWFRWYIAFWMKKTAVLTSLTDTSSLIELAHWHMELRTDLKLLTLSSLPAFNAKRWVHLFTIIIVTFSVGVGSADGIMMFGMRTSVVKTAGANFKPLSTYVWVQVKTMMS